MQPPATLPLRQHRRASLPSPLALCELQPSSHSLRDVVGPEWPLLSHLPLRADPPVSRPPFSTSLSTLASRWWRTCRPAAPPWLPRACDLATRPSHGSGCKVSAGPQPTVWRRQDPSDSAFSTPDDGSYRHSSVASASDGLPATHCDRMSMARQPSKRQ